MLEEIGTLTGLTWAITEGLNRVINRREKIKFEPKLIALGVGLVLGIVGMYAGYLPKTADTFIAISSAILGSQIAHDKILKPIGQVIQGK